MATQNISTTIEKNLLFKLDQIAKETERNRSWLINKALESYLEELEDLKAAQLRLEEERLSPTALRKALSRKSK